MGIIAPHFLRKEALAREKQVLDFLPHMLVIIEGICFNNVFCCMDAGLLPTLKRRIIQSTYTIKRA